MKPLILCIDDHPDLLNNLEMILKFNNYDVITATNGVEAISKLENSENPPQLIISDIIMPEMNGYDLFEQVSMNPKWKSIPFIFLSARTSPEDVRFGKMLGVDDYVKKPFDQDDLLAVVAGKIARHKEIQRINEELDKKIEKISLEISLKPKPEEVFIIKVIWDDILGPSLVKSFPTLEKYPFSLKDIGNQLYSAMTTIYGHGNLTKAEYLLVPIKNIKQTGYIVFDSYPNQEVRGGEVDYMIAIISPTISYFQSLKIKPILQKLSNTIKDNQDISFEPYWEEIVQTL